MQFTKEEDGTPAISEAAIKTLKQKIGSVLFYGIAVDMKLLVALSTLASTQAHGTEKTTRAMLQMLNYCATHMDAVIWYKKSDTILAIHSDYSYLSKPKACSQAGRHFFLTNKPKRGL